MQREKIHQVKKLKSSFELKNQTTHLNGNQSQKNSKNHEQNKLWQFYLSTFS